MVCDYWICKHKQECRERHADRKYTPCACCQGFDKCSHCAEYINCCGLVVRYLPDMFRRLVREIMLGEDTAKTEQAIRRVTDRRKGKR
mgnify:FL=1